VINIKHNYLPDTIIYCTNEEVFWDNKFQSKEYCSNYHGSLWLYYFFIECKKLGINFISSNIAIKNEFNCSNSLILQDGHSWHLKKLIKKGSLPHVLYCLESPLFAYFFYDFKFLISKKFKHNLLFSFSHKDFKNKSQIYFPSHSINHEGYNLEWQKRKDLVLIAANKSAISPIPKKFIGIIKWTYHFLYKKVSPSFNKSYKNQLHSRRFEIINFFGSLGKLDIYGRFWSENNRYNKKDLLSIKPVIDRLNPKFCQNKELVLRDYKFSICFENTAMPGYITEKIIDCFISGVIPIYLGAPDITKDIPKKAFIDIRDFTTLEELNEHIKSINDTEAMEIINRGKEFLKSAEGFKFSYEFFAENTLNLFLHGNNK
jgi:hypothetical protein